MEYDDNCHAFIVNEITLGLSSFIFALSSNMQSLYTLKSELRDNVLGCGTSESFCTIPCISKKKVF